MPCTDRPAPLVCMLSAAHPPTDLRVVGKEGAALAEAGWRVMHLCPGAEAPENQNAEAPENQNAEAPGNPVAEAPGNRSAVPSGGRGAAVPPGQGMRPPGGGAAAPERHAGVAIRRYRRGPGWRGRLLGIPALARQARATGAAVLHASEPDAWLAALLAARQSGARVVLDVHEHYPSRLDGRLPAPLRPLGRAALRLACRALARHADAVVVAKDGLDEDFATAPETIAVRNYAAAAAVAPRRHAEGPLTLVHLGALGRERGAMTMLDALALCPPGTQMRLIGRFTDGSEPEFRARAAALGLEARLEWRGWMPHAAALAEAATADIGLVLFQPGVENHRLALPHKLFDCMLAGLPVIAPAFATEVAAIIRDARNGVLVDSADPGSIAAAVATLARTGRRAEMAARGRAAALGRYGWAGEAARLVALYRRLAPLP